MTDLQKRFADEYLIDSHISKAAERAGIQGDNKRITAWQMLQLPDVQDYIDQQREEISKRCQISQDEWLNEWKKLGFSDIKQFINDDHTAKELSEIDNTGAIKSIKVTSTPIGESVEYTLHDKVNALVNIGKHLGWYEKDNSQQNKVLVPVTGFNIIKDDAANHQAPAETDSGS